MAFYVNQLLSKIIANVFTLSTSCYLLGFRQDATVCHLRLSEWVINQLLTVTESLRTSLLLRQASAI